MNNFRNKLLFILLVTLTGITKVYAYDFEIKQPDLIEQTNYQHLFLDKSMYFNITSAPDAEQKTCEVTYKSFGVVESDTVYNVGNADYSQWLSFPEYAEYNGEKYKVIGIGDHAFQDSTGLTQILYSSNKRYVGKEAFKNCTSLKDIMCMAKYYGESAFEGCASLRMVRFYERPILNSKAFHKCDKLFRVFINEPWGYSYSPEEAISAEDAFDVVDGKINCNLRVNRDIEYYQEYAPWKYFKYIDELSDEVAPLRPDPEEETDAIESVTTSPVVDSRIYTIDGRSVNAQSLDKLPKGVYICGGKKIIK